MPESPQVRTKGSAPTVSVVIPAYNASGFISEAIDSVIAQTRPADEIIIVNDGSPDTRQLEATLERYREHVHYLKQENRGPAAARNTGIRAAASDFIAFLDADDRWLPELLEAQLELITSASAPDFVFADEYLFGDASVAGTTVMEHYPPRGPVTMEALLENRCVVATSTVLARRRSLVETGLFNEAYACCEDFDLWLRLLHGGAHCLYQKRVLACHREHSASITAAARRLLKAQVAVLEQIKGTLDLSGTQSALVDSRIARCEALLALERSKSFLLDGRYQEARQAVAIANEYFHNLKLSLVERGLQLFPGILRFALGRRRGRKGRQAS